MFLLSQNTRKDEQMSTGCASYASGKATLLLSPLLALGLLFVPLMFLANLYRPDAFAIVIMLLVSVIAVVLVVIPIPMLIWLKRWLDPEPVPGTGADEGAPPAP
jgi:hypothetical protein